MNFKKISPNGRVLGQVCVIEVKQALMPNMDLPNMDYNILIHKYLTGEISPEEERLLQAWKTASPENQKNFDDISQIWANASEGEEEMTDETFQEEMAKLDSAIQDSVNKDKLIKKYQRTNLFRNLALAASIVAAGVFAASLYFKDVPASSISFSNSPNNILILPDSTQVLLNRNSSITFNRAEDTHQAILSGEAIFYVREEANPFTVSVQGVSLTVAGTSFLIKSYADSAIQVSVMSGSATVRCNNQQATLALGEKIIATQSGALTKSVNDDPNFNSWYTRKLEFRNTELETVLRLVEELYQISFLVEDKKLLGCRFTGKFDDATIEDILNTLAFSLDIEFILQPGSHYQVSGPGCVP